MFVVSVWLRSTVLSQQIVLLPWHLFLSACLVLPVLLRPPSFAVRCVWAFF